METVKMNNSDKCRKVFKTIGDKVRSRRKELSLTQAQVSTILNCHKRYYQRIESGQASITVATLHKIAEALCTPIESLLHSDEATQMDLDTNKTLDSINKQKIIS